MKNIILASGCNQEYYSKMLPYMISVKAHNTYAKQMLVGVGWKPPPEHGFTPLELSHEEAVGHGGIHCVQHGAFLNKLHLHDDDVMIFTDGSDVIMQRDFSPLERLELETMSPETVRVGFNAGPSDTLGSEAERLGPRVPITEIGTRFDLSLPVYNTGVIVATGYSWRIIYKEYMKLWPVVDPLFSHHARQQWLISYILGTDPRLGVEWLPYSFHTHGCYPLPANITRDDTWVIYDKGERVLFKHHLGY